MSDTGVLCVPAEGASMQVNVRGGGAATVYAAETGAPTVANPLTVDGQGKVSGWVDDGSYDLAISPGGRRFPILNPNRTCEASSGASTRAAVPSGFYRMLLDSSGSHTAARVAGTYGMPQGDPLAITGVGTPYPLNAIAIDSAEFPMVGALSPKFRVKAQLYTNDVPPTGNFTVGLHPVTRPATSGAAGLCIYTIGSAVPGSTTTFTAPAADAQLGQAGADFALPANGHYVIGVVTSAAVAASAHLHLSAQLQTRNA